MNAPLRDDQLLTIVKNVVEQNGCRLVDIDFDNHILQHRGLGGGPGTLRPGVGGCIGIGCYFAKTFLRRSVVRAAGRVRIFSSS